MTLPDDVLLEIFKRYVDVWDALRTKWHTLVHVCRRWRHVVFGSPRHLDLQLVYTGRRPMTEMPDIWPASGLPIVIRLPWGWHSVRGVSFDDNMIAALDSERHNRVCRIDLPNISASLWERLTAVMQRPFPELTVMHLSSENHRWSIDPHSFLVGPAPRLRRLFLDNIPFPAVQRLLLSANNLVYLSLRNIPGVGYISPEDMANCLAGLTRLEVLILQFRSPRSHRLSEIPRQLPPPLAPFVLPALTRLEFQGRSYYLERLVARIDAPVLLYLGMIFFQDDNFDVPQLHRFISHAEKLRTHARATVSHSNTEIRLTLSSPPWTVDRTSLAAFGILYSGIYLPLSSLAQVCKSSFPLLSTLEELDVIKGCRFPIHWDNRVERMQWLELLGLFTSLKNLRLDEELALPVMHALNELVEERERAVLPELQSIFIEGLQSSENVQDVVDQFVTTRRLSNQRVAVHDWEP